MLVSMKNRLFSKNFFLVAVLVCVIILNFYPQRNYNAVMNPSKAIASTTDDVAEQVLVKSADDVAVGAVASSADDIAVSATAGSRQAEKQLLSGSEWNEYFQQTYGAENVQWAMQGQSSVTKGLGSGEKITKTTLDYLKDVEKINGSYYTPKNVIDEIGKAEARGINFSKLNSNVMSSRASTEGGFSKVIRYSDNSGTKFIIHEVTDNTGNLLHRDFDAVRIQSGQLINKLSK